MNNLDIFKDLDYETMKNIYQNILAKREEGLRPKCLDGYIKKVQAIYPLTFGEAWKYTESLFWEEIGRRYFEK